MVNYEVALIMRAAKKADLAESLKRICITMMQQGSIIKQIDNLGEMKLPYRMRSMKKEIFSQGRYFVLDVEAPPTNVFPLRQKLRRDADIVRVSILKPK